MRYFTSDTHFGSDWSIRFNYRPFKNSKSYLKFSIREWNKQTNKDDIIYVIGDFVDCHDKEDRSRLGILSIVKKLKAKVILLMGNNEHRIVEYFFDNSFEKFRSYCLSLGFQDVKENDTITINGTEFYLTHKPTDCKDGTLNLFGHSHKAMGIYKSFGFNIGCDLNNYRLYSEDDIMDLNKKKKKYWDEDENLKLI